MYDDEVSRVLIVDDDPGLRELLAALLARDGIASFIAEDGIEAVEKLANETFSVVLLDLLMPRMDGLGVLRFMREAGIVTPVVVVSAASDEWSEALDPHQVRVAVKKPFDPGELQAIVAAVIAKSKHHESAAR